MPFEQYWGLSSETNKSNALRAVLGFVVRNSLMPFELYWFLSSETNKSNALRAVLGFVFRNKSNALRVLKSNVLLAG